MKKVNLKANSGFTMTDLIIALLIFSIFTGLIGTLMYSSVKVNVQTKMAGAAANYAIQILEDIDKMSYEGVTNGMEDYYRTKLLLPTGFDLLIEVSNYNDGTDKEDLIKIVQLTISYKIANSSEKLRIEKLKVKEL